MFDDQFKEVLELTGNGTKLCARMTNHYLENHYQIQELALGLLSRKALDHLEAASTVLGNFHLESSRVLLRVALETIGLLGLCLDDIESLEEWMFLTSLKREQFSNSNLYEDFVRPLQLRGRTFYDRLLGSSDEPTPASDLIKDYNAHVHASWPGLLASLGFEPSQGPFPLEAEQALEDSKGNLRLAIPRFRQLRQQSRRSERQLAKWAGKVPDQIGSDIVYGEVSSVWDELATTAIELLSGTHHLFDILDERFGRPPQESTEFDLWHKQSLQKMANGQG